MQLPRWPASHRDTIEYNHKQTLSLVIVKTQCRCTCTLCMMLAHAEGGRSQEHRGRAGQSYGWEPRVVNKEREWKERKINNKWRTVKETEKRRFCLVVWPSVLGCREDQPLGYMDGLAKSLLHRVHWQTGSGQTNTRTHRTTSHPDPGCSRHSANIYEVQ